MLTEELIRRGVDAFNRRDVEAFLELVNPDVEFQTRVLPGSYRGRGAIRSYFREWVVEPWEELHLEIVGIELCSPAVGLAEMQLKGLSREVRTPVEMRYWDVFVTDPDGLLLKRTVFMDESEARAEVATLVRSGT